MCVRCDLYAICERRGPDEGVWKSEDRKEPSKSIETNEGNGNGEGKA